MALYADEYMGIQERPLEAIYGQVVLHPVQFCKLLSAPFVEPMMTLARRHHPLIIQLYQEYEVKREESMPLPSSGHQASKKYRW